MVRQYPEENFKAQACSEERDPRPIMNLMLMDDRIARMEEMKQIVISTASMLMNRTTLGFSTGRNDDRGIRLMRDTLVEAILASQKQVAGPDILKNVAIIMKQQEA